MMDLGIGDVLNARVAGNTANDDILGSMEFARQRPEQRSYLVDFLPSAVRHPPPLDNRHLISTATKRSGPGSSSSWLPVPGVARGTHLRIAGRILLAALLLWATQAAAQPVCPPPPAHASGPALQRAVQNARNRGALWRFEKDGRYGYLYTTVHVGKIEWAPPGPAVARALRDAEMIAVEAGLSDPAFNAAMIAPQTAEEAPTLSPPLVARMRARAVKLCAPWERLERMPAMMIATTLTLLDAGWDGLHADYATEFVLAGFAKSTNKPLVALETAAVQRAALMGGTPAEQLATIEAVVQGLDDGTSRKEVLATANAWASGDLDALTS